MNTYKYYIDNKFNTNWLRWRDMLTKMKSLTETSRIELIRFGFVFRFQSVELKIGNNQIKTDQCSS